MVQKEITYGPLFKPSLRRTVHLMMKRLRRDAWELRLEVFISEFFTHATFCPPSNKVIS